MEVLITSPDFDVEMMFSFKLGEKVTEKDVAGIADDMCDKAYGSKVLGKFIVTIDGGYYPEHSIGVQMDEDGCCSFSPRENSNVGVFITRNRQYTWGGWHSNSYINPDGERHGHYISNDLSEVSQIEDILETYTHLYSLSVYEHSGMTISLCNDDIIPTIRRELEKYDANEAKFDDIDEAYESGEYSYDDNFSESFVETLEFFKDDIYYGVVGSEWLACMGTDSKIETAEKVYEAARSEVKCFDQYLNETQYGTTMDGDLEDWCWGFYNDEYGVQDQIIEQCIRPMHDAGLIEYVD